MEIADRARNDKKRDARTNHSPKAYLIASEIAALRSQ
jgi:hypothetical protein